MQFISTPRPRGVRVPALLLTAVAILVTSLAAPSAHATRGKTDAVADLSRPQAPREQVEAAYFLGLHDPFNFTAPTPKGPVPPHYVPGLSSEPALEGIFEEYEEDEPAAFTQARALMQKFWNKMERVPTTPEELDARSVLHSQRQVELENDAREISETELRALNRELFREMPGIGLKLTREELAIGFRALSTAESALADKMRSLKEEHEKERRERIRKGLPTLDRGGFGGPGVQLREAAPSTDADQDGAGVAL